MIKRSLKKRRGYFLAVTMVVLLLVGFNFCQAADAPKVKELKWALFFAESAYQSPSVKKFRDDIEAYTNGAVKPKLYWVGQIAETKDLPDLIRTGAADMITTSANYHQAIYPLNAALQAFPMLFKSTEQAAYTWLNLFRDFPEIQGEFAKNNEYCLSRVTLAKYLTVSSKPLRTIADFKGLKIRTFPGRYNSEWMKSLGANNIDMPMSDLYESLMRKVMDATALNVQFMESLKIYEVAKYVSFDFGTIVGWQTSMNLKVWNGLTPEMQKGIIRAASEFSARDLELNLTSEKKSIESLNQKGVQFITVDPKEQKAFLDKAGDPWAAAKEFLAKDLKVDAAVADRFLKRWRDLNNEYETKYARTGKKWDYK
jgi:TRAP-type transport system periplasmic protein